LGAGNENDVTVSKLFQAGHENEVTVTIFKLVVNGNDLTVTSGGNDAHLCLSPKKSTHNSSRQSYKLPIPK
jgi:hypothetical protein